MFNRILLFGGTASGKTTISKIMSRMIEIPSYSTDNFVYKEKWHQKYDQQEIPQKVKAVTKKKKWIIEGVHSKEWLIPAVKKADLIVILDLPRFTLFKRVIIREWRRKNSFKNLLLLLKYAYIYKNDHFLEHKKFATDYHKKYILLKNEREIKLFLRKLESDQSLLQR